MIATMKNSRKIAATISAEEMHSRRQIHEASRHSLALEGLDEFLSPEADALSEAWIRGEITLEAAIAHTLQDIRSRSAAKANDIP